MKQRTRKHPADRKAEILTAALHEARAVGYRAVTRDAVAVRAGCSPALISAHFGTMLQFHRAVMSAAIARSDLPVIAQGLAAGDPKAQRAPEAVKRAALEGLMHAGRPS